MLSCSDGWPECQALADDPAQRAIRPCRVIHAQLDPVAVAEIELGHVAVQVLLRAVLVNALHAALEHAVEPLNRVRVRQAPHILARAMTGEIVGGEQLAEGVVLACLIRHHLGGRMDVRLDDRQEIGRTGALDVEGPGRTATLNQCQDRVLVGIAALLRHVLLLPDERLVDLHDRALATHRRQRASRHRLAQAVGHEPAGLDRHAERAGELVAADALLAAAHQVHGLEPLVQFDMAGLEHRADRHTALLAAGVALVEARPGRGAAHALHAIRAAAVRADGAVRPHDAFQLRIGGGFIVEEGLAEDAGHGIAPSMKLSYP